MKQILVEIKSGDEVIWTAKNGVSFHVLDVIPELLLQDDLGEPLLMALLNPIKPIEHKQLCSTEFE
ncbi:hypothetical protein [Vibrio sp. EJY3]|uniref:hypothetical protein n=1 Tax=Vibrio sp. (strain EJY3) TaxID=1116375 RepID=UPI000243B8C1|nr:hypothetical protein [Vibrio sp. EJY3]AEX24925.1 hypothetical protein VEJY3_22571 [Vibrio sp. EJY3]